MGIFKIGGSRRRPHTELCPGHPGQGGLLPCRHSGVPPSGTARHGQPRHYSLVDEKKALCFIGFCWQPFLWVFSTGVAGAMRQDHPASQRLPTPEPPGQQDSSLEGHSVDRVSSGLREASLLSVIPSSEQTCCLPCAPRVSGSACLGPIGLLQLLGSVVGRGGLWFLEGC